jgi:hypothetical protein
MLDTPPKSLREAEGLSPSIAQRLAGYGIFDSAQLLGAVGIDGVERRLAEGMGVERSALAEAVAAARRTTDWSLDDAFEGLSADDGPMGFEALPPSDAMAAEFAGLASVLATPPLVPPAVNRRCELPRIVNQGGSVGFAARALVAHHRRQDSVEPGAFDTPSGPSLIRALQRLTGANHAAPLVLAAHDVRGAKNALAERRLLGVTIPVYASWAMSPGVQRNGRITLRLGEEPAVGGQALVIVGYQDKADYPGGGYFVVRAGWSADWAQASPYGPGCGSLPYAYVAREAWELAGLV